MEIENENMGYLKTIILLVKMGSLSMITKWAVKHFNKIYKSPRLYEVF